ncbi:MAG: Rpp14/Pop5 family protein [Candidatus Thermoplasmatota archaeon]|nr:Rpp14/Pop5 family protein [Candidatus Thermoplasmatota archaeon]
MVHPYRRRYVAIKVQSPERPGKGLVIKMVRSMTQRMSEDDFRRLKAWVVYYCEGFAIIKTSLDGLDDMMSILEKVQGVKVSGGDFRFEVLGVSGTIKGAFNRFIPGGVRAKRHYHEERSEGR